MNYYIGSDHAGYKLKEFIKTAFPNLNLQDLGTHQNERCDYTDFANEVATKVSQDPINNRGILVCGSGVGMSIAANKHKDTRAVLCENPYIAKMSKQHNDSNIVCLGQNICGEGLAVEIIESWLEATFEGGRHIARLEKML